jgi:hypothetical protein
MTNEQNIALCKILYDARDLLHAIDKGWVRLQGGDGDSTFIMALRKSVAHAQCLNIPAIPHPAK